MQQRLQQRERPDQSPVMYQNWRNLLFLHWEYDAELIQRTLPAGLTVDTFEGKAYLGVVPFFMEDVRPRFLPTVPGISDFQELNVRTYVYDQSGRPGVWFYSLDANQWLAVKTARTTFNLPYYHATMESQRDEQTGEIFYSCYRHDTPEKLKSEYRYQPLKELPLAEPGSFEFFLLERYILFAFSQWTEKLYSGQVHHPPYPIYEVDVKAFDDHPLQLDGFSGTARTPDHAIMSPGVDVDIFSLQSID